MSFFYVRSTNERLKVGVLNWCAAGGRNRRDLAALSGNSYCWRALHCSCYHTRQLPWPWSQPNFRQCYHEYNPRDSNWAFQHFLVPNGHLPRPDQWLHRSSPCPPFLERHSRMAGCSANKQESQILQGLSYSKKNYTIFYLSYASLVWGRKQLTVAWVTLPGPTWHGHLLITLF